MTKSIDNSIVNIMLKVIVILLFGLSNLPQAAPCVALYDQCGGSGWLGLTKCCSESTCTADNLYYSRCLTTSNSSTSDVITFETRASRSGNSGRRNGVTTRYWDCCKASCGWPGKASVTRPVKTCARNGVTAVDVNTPSGHTGGTGFMCSSQQPWSVSSSLSYGFAAAHLTNKKESDWCCACYSLKFTSGPVAGKKLIVQVTNSGGDLGNNHFDLQIPGGGVGLFDGCSRQFSGRYSWGDPYGGVKSRSDCDKLPAAIRRGCFWRFDWFQNANNPSMTFKKVKCPSVLTAKTKCIRK